MKSVVYLLGAGFSAPIGLPVMSDFLLKSKDLYFEDPEQYAHFLPIFKLIDAMGKAKTYFEINLLNIEEILSLLEMEDYALKKRHSKRFARYLADVIEACTPHIELQAIHVSRGRHWSRELFRPTPATDPVTNRILKRYCQFVAALFNMKHIFKDGQPQQDIYLGASIESGSIPRYSVITLNYDILLEKFFEAIKIASKLTDESVGYQRDPEGQGTVPLAKLHGSVEPLSIVPPTWNKHARDEVKGAWRLAYSALSEANEIRIIGYSLAESDSYIRYLLESSALRTNHLKAIDVMCLDDSGGSVQSRYDNLVTFDRYRFRRLDVVKYLACLDDTCIAEKVGKRQNELHVSFDLEAAHEKAFVVE